MILSEKYWRHFHCQTDMLFHYLKLCHLNFPACLISTQLKFSGGMKLFLLLELSTKDKNSKDLPYIIYVKKNTEIPRFHFLPWLPPSDETPKGAIFLHIWMVAFCLLQAFSDTFLEFLPPDQCKFLYFFLFCYFSSG